MSKTKKTILRVVITGTLIIAAAAGALTLQYFRSHRPTVYAASDWAWSIESGGEKYSYGTVTTEGIQPVTISSTQKVSEVYVQEGQEVHVGDPLVAFDTTLTEINLERKEIAVQQLELELEQKQTQLNEINHYLIGTDGSWSYSYTYSTGTLSYAPYMPYITSSSVEGRQEEPIVYLWDDSCSMTDAFIRDLIAMAQDSRGEDEPEEDPEDEPEDDPEDEPEEEPADPEQDPTQEPEEVPEQEQTPEQEQEQPQEQEPEQEQPPEQEPEPEPEAEAPEAGSETEQEPALRRRSMNAGDTKANEEEKDPEPEPGPDTDPEDEDKAVYVVFEVRTDNAVNGTLERCWEIKIDLDSDGNWVIYFINPVYQSAEEVHDETVYYDYIDTNTYYTSQEVAALRTACEKEIQNLTLQLETAKIDYERAEYEMQNGIVYSEIDGVVKTVRSSMEALKANKPLIMVSAGGGYYISSTIDEYDLQTMQAGDTVTVMCYTTGTMCEGTITEISPYAVENTDSGYSENENVSSYPVTVYVDEDASLTEDSYVEICYSTSGSSGIYLNNAFIRQEDGESCVYAVGDDGKLHRMVVKLGSSDGYTSSVLQGLDADELDSLYLAYLYDGSRIREGASVQYAQGSDVYYGY